MDPAAQAGPSESPKPKRNYTMSSAAIQQRRQNARGRRAKSAISLPTNFSDTPPPTPIQATGGNFTSFDVDPSSEHEMEGGLSESESQLLETIRIVARMEVQRRSCNYFPSRAPAPPPRPAPRRYSHRYYCSAPSPLYSLASPRPR